MLGFIWTKKGKYIKFLRNGWPYCMKEMQKKAKKAKKAKKKSKNKSAKSA